MKKRDWLILFVFVAALIAAACGGEPLPACTPAPELCDEVDNDCDGQTDEDFPLGRECVVGLGECKRTGHLVCASDKRSAVCDAAPAASSEEICDGKDNNCDGATDEEPAASLSCDDNVACTRDTCVNGQCIRTPDDSLCDDHNVCNGIEKCDLTLGCVAGTPLNCNDNDVCNGVETCDPIQGCQPGTPLQCDDGKWCNGAEWCDPTNGCQLGMPPALSDDIDCTADSCDEENDRIVCISNDTLCSDHNICNGIETCDALLGCQAGRSLICDDNNVCNGIETCDPALGCQPGASLPCDDGLFCDGQETCDPIQGCKAGVSLVLSDDIECTADSCDEENNKIVHTPNDAICSDQNVCNGIETCDVSSGCKAGTPLVCDDGFFCNGQETCDPVNGCQPGTPPTLSDNIFCTIDTCDEVNDKIVHMPDNALCSDNNICNGIETCDVVLGCKAGITLNCDDGNICNGVETCHPVNGCQSGAPLICDDGLFCNGVERCDSVNGCQPGILPELSDVIPCTVDSCDETTDKIVHAPNDTLCSDNNVCNGIEKCDLALGCIAGIPLVCDDGNICNGAETCDSVLGCQPGAPLVCDDGLFCNGAETCQATSGCQPGTPPTLSDNIPCTIDTCDEINNKIVHMPNDTACSDNNVCNGVETCHPTLGCQADTPLQCDDGLFCNGQETCDPINGCQAGIPPTLSDDISCTVDTCDEVNDKVVHAPDNAACSDNNVCNGIETCDVLLGCKAGTPLQCDDGLFCNGQETCDSVQGCQSGTAPDCASLNDQCNVGVCDETNDQCKKQPVNEGQNCNDDSICTSVNVCQNGICVGTADKDSDEDGYIDEDCGGTDCNDDDNLIHPGALEICDGKDNNCNGVIDNGSVGGGSQVSDATIGTLDNSSIVWTGSAYGVAWSDYRDGNNEIYFARIGADGTRIGNDVRITNAIGGSLYPSLVWADTQYGVAWYDYRNSNSNSEIYFARIDANGNKIGSDIRITNASGLSYSPSLVWNGTEYGVSWSDERSSSLNSEIYFARIDVNGNKIGNDVKITSASYLSDSPSLVWAGNEYGLAWRDGRNSEEVFFTRISAAGVKIGSDINISFFCCNSSNPSLVWAGDKYGLTWDHSTHNGTSYVQQIYFAILDSSGNKITPWDNIQITDDAQDSYSPSLVWTEANFGITWAKGREIFFTYLDTSGVKLIEDVQLTQSSYPRRSLKPSFIWNGTEYAASWYSDYSGTDEIYFTRIEICY